MSRNITFDDRDTDRIRYSNEWFLPGSYIATNTGESGTLASSDGVNATLTFTFPVPATAFFYFGMPRCCGGLYQICVDCDPNNQRFTDVDAVVRTDDGNNPPIVLFSQRFATAGIHEVILRNQVDARFGKSQITLDRFVLEIPDDTVQTKTETFVQTTSIKSAGPSPSTPNHPKTSNGNTKVTPSPVPIGAIVGIAVGVALIVVGSIIAACWYRRRRKRLQKELEDMRQYVTENAALTPYPLGGGQGTHYASATTIPASPPAPAQGFSRTHKGHHPSTSDSSSRTNPYANLFVPVPQREGGQPSVAGSESTNLSYKTSSSHPVERPSLGSPPPGEGYGPRRLRAQDGGPVAVPDEEDEDDFDEPLPPEYGEVFPNRRRTRVSTTMEQAASPRRQSIRKHRPGASS